MRTRVALWSALVLAWACASCSSGPRPPEPGTPAFIWGAAKETYHTGDFRKTSENLVQLIQTDNDFTARARPLAAVISAGLAQGYFDLAENYEAGARANRADPTPFRKQVSASRSLSSAAALEFAENIHAFLEKDKEPNVVLACEYPTGSMAEPAGIHKVAKGMLMQDSEKDLLETAMLQRGVVLAMSRFLGAPEDAAKTLELFKAGEPTVPRATFAYGTAKALYDLSALWGPQKLDLPNRLQMMCQEALDALHSVPETKETKALTAKIQATLKKSRPMT
ncbi:MAG: hypothetical protein ACLQU1_32965 [Bryobacteraceae bacterium]